MSDKQLGRCPQCLILRPLTKLGYLHGHYWPKEKGGRHRGTCKGSRRRPVKGSVTSVEGAAE